MNNTEKRLEKHTKEVIIEQIDICLSGQDPRYQLGRYIEHLKEEIIHQALAEDRERVVEKIKSMSLQSQNSIDKLPEDSERNRISNLLNANMVIGYQVALIDLLSSLKDK